MISFAKKLGSCLDAKGKGKEPGPGAYEAESMAFGTI